MSAVARNETLAVRLPPEEWARLERLKAHFRAKYPFVTMNDATVVKIALQMAERAELGAEADPPAAPSSRPRAVKKTSRAKR